MASDESAHHAQAKTADEAPRSDETMTDKPEIQEIDATTVTPEVDQQAAESENQPETPTPEALMQQLEQVKQEAKNHWETILRKQAEYENVQKRAYRDVEQARKYALEKFATALLAVKDSMELGLEAAAKPETQKEVLQEGMELTLKMLADTLDKFDIEEINPQGDKFDPQWHEAMALQPDPDAAEGTVLHVHQKGYQLNDRLLRPARVIVSKKTELSQQTPEAEKNS